MKNKNISLFVVVEVGKGGRFKEAIRAYRDEQEALNHANSLNKAYPRLKWIVAPSFMIEEKK